MNINPISALRSIFLVLFLALISTAWAQADWKLTKNKDGIKVYQKDMKNSNFKAIKVECTLQGTYDKLIGILGDVSRHKEWVYNNKSASILKKNSPFDFYYYTETTLPWPMANRDAIMHLTMRRDSANRHLKISSIAAPDYIAEKEGKVRVKQSTINWLVTMPTTSTVSIIYTFEANPGGNVPAWMANNFADKGPFESFKKLADLLKK